MEGKVQGGFSRVVIICFSFSLFCFGRFFISGPWRLPRLSQKKELRDAFNTAALLGSRAGYRLLLSLVVVGSLVSLSSNFGRLVRVGRIARLEFQTSQPLFAHSPARKDDPVL